MHFSLIYVGEKPAAWAEQVCSQYAKRLPSQFGYTQSRVAPIKRNKNTMVETARAEEWQHVIEKVSRDSLKVLLDERGKQLSSNEFAQQLKHWQQNGKDVAFIIAGADGVNDADRKSADFLLALSKLTLPHELARVLLTEQIYRGWSILNQHPYHRA